MNLNLNQWSMDAFNSASDTLESSVTRTFHCISSFTLCTSTVADADEQALTRGTKGILLMLMNRLSQEGSC